MSNEKVKDLAHGNASHATQTGKGLLFYAKRAEDKDHPQGIINLVSFGPWIRSSYNLDADLVPQADVSEPSKGNFNDFSLLVNGHKYTFQAITRAERDGWIVAIDGKSKEAKTTREGLVGSAGYKSQLEKYCE